MARLPGEQDLGPTPSVNPSRGIASFDVSPMARAGQVGAQDVQQLGKGISALGEGVGDLGLDETRWDYSKAHADFLTGKNDIDAQFSKDGDFATLTDRYQKAITDQQQQSAALIPSGPMRERFLTETGVQASAGVKAADVRAQALEGNANTAWVSQKGDELIDGALTPENEAVGYGGADAAHAQAVTTYGAMVDGLVTKGWATPQQGLQSKRQFIQRFATADALSRLDQAERTNNPAAAQAVVDELRAARGTMPAGGPPGQPGFTAPSPSDIDSLPSGPGARGARVNAAVNYFVGKGYTPVQASGIVGNLLGETGWLNPQQSHDGGVGLGIAGWNGQRLAALKSFATANGTSPTSLSTQLDFIDHELKTTESAAGQQLAQATTPEQAGQAVLSYERPAGWNAPGGHPERARLARQVFDGLGAAAPGGDASNGGTGGGAQVASNDGSVPASAGGSGAAQPQGQQPAGGNIYSFLRPDQREQLLQHALGSQHKVVVQQQAAFGQSVQDDLAESDRTGGVANPKTADQFLQVYGNAAGPQIYTSYRDALQLGADKQRAGGMAPADQNALVESYAPKPGPGYADQAKRQDILVKALSTLQKQKSDDPGLYAVSRLPVVSDAWGKLQTTLGDPTADADAKTAAARDFAAKTTAEQQRVGVAPESVAILPGAYVDRINDKFAAAAGSDDPKARTGLIQAVQSEAATWGENWPQVMRQLAPKTQPLVRAIAAGADPGAMARLLSLGPDQNPAKVLKEQSETKASDLTTALNTEMHPFLQSLVGRQRDRDYPGYYDLANKLAALNVRDGQSASDAAHNAFDALIGNRYDFRDTYRIPKSAGVSADDVQAGAQAARDIIAGGQSDEPDLQKNFERNAPYVASGASNFQTTLGSADEASFRQWLGKNKVPFDPSSTAPQDYDMRGFWKGLQGGDERATAAVDPNDGKLHYPDYWKTPYHQTFSNESQWANASAPSWNGKDQLVDKSGAVVFDDRAANRTAFDIKPAIANIPGLSDNRADSLGKFGRDGVWVTSPDNSGLNLVYGDKFVRSSSGKPFALSWGQLAGIAHGAHADAAASLQGDMGTAAQQ